VTLGGEHTIAVGSFRAHRDRYPGLSVLAIDAHADLRDEYLDTRYNHACTLRRSGQRLAASG
jgi:agmatinase